MIVRKYQSCNAWNVIVDLGGLECELHFAQANEPSDDDVAAVSDIVIHRLMDEAEERIGGAL